LFSRYSGLESLDGNAPLHLTSGGRLDRQIGRHAMVNTGRCDGVCTVGPYGFRTVASSLAALESRSSLPHTYRYCSAEEASPVRRERSSARTGDAFAHQKSIFGNRRLNGHHVYQWTPVAGSRCIAVSFAGRAVAVITVIVPGRLGSEGSRRQ